MSFVLQIRRNGGALIELKKIQLWQRIVYQDNSEEKIKVAPKIVPLLDTEKPMQQAGIFFKNRDSEYVFYQAETINEDLKQTVKLLTEKLYFQFESELPKSYKISDIKKIEYSVKQNFSEILTQKVFNEHYRFRKITNMAFDFFLLNEDGKKFFAKRLTPYETNAPAYDVKIVEHSIECKNLQTGFYDIDGEKWFLDKNFEIKPNHYILKITL